MHSDIAENRGSKIPNLGGYFAQLTLGIEKNSFNEGEASIKKIGEGVKSVDADFTKFIKNSITGLVGLSAAAVGAGAAMSMMQSKALISAQVAGMNTKEYTNWANAMKLVIGTSDGLEAGASKLEKTFIDKVVNPQAYEQLATNLALISRNLNIMDVEHMSNAERIRAISDAVMSKNGDAFRQAANRAGDILGPNFTNFLFALKDQGLTPSQALSQADSLRMVTDQSQQDAMTNAAMLNKTKVLGEQIGDKGLTDLLTALRPSIDMLNTWLMENKDAIVNAMKTFGETLNKILLALGSVFGTIGGAVNEYSKERSRAQFLALNGGLTIIPMIEDQLKKQGLTGYGYLDDVSDTITGKTSLRESRIKTANIHNDAEKEIIDFMADPARYQKSFSIDDESKVLGTKLNGTVNITMGDVKLDEAGTRLFVNYMKDNPTTNIESLVQAILALKAMAGQK